MKKNILLILAILILAIFPLILEKGAHFGGTDNEAKTAITEIDSNYKPWFHSIWKPPSSEVESLLFSVQAAAGAGFIGYFIGYTHGKSRLKKEKSKNDDTD